MRSRARLGANRIGIVRLTRQEEFEKQGGHAINDNPRFEHCPICHEVFWATNQPHGDICPKCKRATVQESYLAYPVSTQSHQPVIIHSQ